MLLDIYSVYALMHELSHELVDPNFLISGISMLIVSRAKLVGNKYLEATK